MKNILAITILAILFCSCKNDYNCECTYKTTSTVHTITDQTKKNATKTCEEINSNWQDSDGTCIIVK